VANRRMQQQLYLHRSCVPLDMADLEHEKTLFLPMTNERQGMCGGEAIPPHFKKARQL
jgi:hypothetical protein